MYHKGLHEVPLASEVPFMFYKGEVDNRVVLVRRNRIMSEFGRDSTEMQPTYYYNRSRDKGGCRGVFLRIHLKPYILIVRLWARAHPVQVIRICPLGRT